MGAPQVAYKETIKKSVEQDTKYARQSGGKGQYGHVRITVEPNEPGKGYEFLNEITGGVIPKGYIPRSTPVFRAPCRRVFWPVTLSWT